MPTVLVGGEPVYYAARGEEGAPIIMVHGAASNHLIWNAQLAALAGSARAYALDLSGHGRSGGGGHRSIRLYADSVCSFLDALEIERAILVGHSMGGAIAQTIGLENPDRVAGLALVGTGAKLRVLREFLDGIMTDLQLTAHRITEAEFAPETDIRLKELSEQQFLKCDPAVIHGDWSACDSFDVLSKVAEINKPTLVVCGIQDKMTPVKYSQFLSAKIPNATLRLIEGGGHMVMLERPDAVSRALLDWIPSVGFH